MSLLRTNRWPAPALVAAALLQAPAFGQTPGDDELRVSALYRCGDLLESKTLEFCLTVRGGNNGRLRLVLDGTLIGETRLGNEAIRLTLGRDDYASGPLWVEQGDRQSNAAWLSMQTSATVAAPPDEVARNPDGITSYVKLVSVLIEEVFDPLPEVRRIAAKYGAQLVGSIPPLRIYQLRLPVDDLIHRDALVLRLNGEESIDAVIVEESSSEDAAEEPHASGADAELSANRFVDAIDYYRRRVPGPAQAPIRPTLLRIGIIERSVDFDTPDFGGLVRPASGALRLFARDASRADTHGTTVTGILAARWDGAGDNGFLRALDGHHAGIDIIVDRGSDAGITANVATSVRLVQDGVRVLNWSWGIHRIGAVNLKGESIDSVVRSGVAFEGYEEMLEEFFKWLRKEYPGVVVVNSAGNSDYYSDNDDYRLPSSFVTPQLLVVGSHQRTARPVPVEAPDFAAGRGSSNIGERVDITAAACVRGSDPATPGNLHCGTSYSTAIVTGIVGAMLTINPALSPADVRTLLRRASLPIGGDVDFEPADMEDLTAPILPSERAEQLEHPDVGRSARLDMREALVLTVRSLFEE